MNFQELVQVVCESTRMLQCSGVYKYFDSLGREQSSSVTKHNTEDGDEFWVDENGMSHRDELPAMIVYHRKTKIPQMVEYFRHGKRHKVDGPANVIYTINSEIDTQEYWIDGKQYNKEEYESIVKNTSPENIADISSLRDVF